MKRKIICSLVFSVLLMLPLAGYGQKAKDFYKAAGEFMSTGNYTDAIDQYTRAIGIDPEYADAYVDRGYAYEKSGDLTAAVEDFNRAAVFMPDNTDVFYDAGRVYFEMSKYEDALTSLNKALELKKSNLAALQVKIKALIDLEKYEEALAAAEQALILKSNEVNYYYHGLVNELLNKNNIAQYDYEKSISKDKQYLKAYVALINLYVKMNNTDDAMDVSKKLFKRDDKYADGYVARSHIYQKLLDYPNAINDMSRAILIEPGNASLYLLRGTYYQEFAQHQNAINDFNKALLLDNKNAMAYYKRAYSYEQVANYKAAVKDYQSLVSMSDYDIKAKKLLDKAKQRMFELSRETDKPVLKLESPAPSGGLAIEVPLDKKIFSVKGKINDESELAYLKVNGNSVPFVKTNDGYDFMAEVTPDQNDEFTIGVADVYDNITSRTYSIRRTEVDPPQIAVLAPYASDNGLIYLDSDSPTLYVEGKVSDMSQIKSIMIDGVAASYKVDDPNPGFSAYIPITNKNAFTVKATDAYGNQSEKTFKLSREGIQMVEGNPMGKTWVVFISNSSYESFASIEGPPKDVTLMKAALARYKVNNIIYKNDMDKKEMERFFSIELRDLVRSNHVNSLLVWYAGHGKFINETGYWIPVDATRDDEFSYFNINSLKAALQGYSETVTHTLVVTDACESGPTFYQAMRAQRKERSCNDWQATRFKSSQVFSSAGYELAVDNSQFTRTFANALVNNPNACIPIESIVDKVTVAVEKNSQQQPKFGKIAGLVDEDGTFFFITKE